MQTTSNPLAPSFLTYVARKIRVQPDKLGGIKRYYLQQTTLYVVLRSRSITIFHYFELLHHGRRLKITRFNTTVWHTLGDCADQRAQDIAVVALVVWSLQW